MIKNNKMTQRAPSPDAEPFSWPVRVYYEDTDGAGVVYYANYLKFLERARTEWLRALGHEQPELAEREGVVFVVRALSIDYLRPARFNDSLRVTVAVANRGAARLDLAQRVLRGDAVLATADVNVACVRRGTFRPVRIPKDLVISMGKTP